jgi:hypothetical protein
VVLEALDVSGCDLSNVFEVSDFGNDVHTKVILVNVILESRFMLELSFRNIECQLGLKQPI